jgi:hypothetical protein
MARAIWSGALSFGLVTIPVKAFAAVRDHTIHFNQLEAETGSRIKYKKVSEKSGREVDADKIEKGYEITKGEYVIVDPDELADLKPRSTRDHRPHGGARNQHLVGQGVAVCHLDVGAALGRDEEGDVEEGDVEEAGGEEGGEEAGDDEESGGGVRAPWLVGVEAEVGVIA